jgi:hypothetical protein
MKYLNTTYALVVAALLAAPLSAQLTSGNLVGTVFDPSGAIVPGAAIALKNTATGAEEKTVSTSAGDYRFENLPVGTYDLTATAAGFKDYEVKGVAVQLNVTVTENVRLSIGSAASTVEVTESAVTIDTTTAQIQSTFGARQAADLPTTATGSGVLNLALLNPAVATSGTVGVGTGPSVAGQRPRNNNFTVEGIDNNSGSVTGPLVTVPNDAVAEFGTLQNQFSPDFGHSSGGQFNTIVKSGSNQFHGTLYEYFQNRDLNAADNLAAVSGTPLHPRYDNNRFGGNVGGPILRNKLFFFVDYEYNPIGEASTPSQLFAPTATGLNQIAAIPGINQNNFNIFKKYVPVAGSACVPGVGNCPSVIVRSLALGPGYLQPTLTGTAIQVGQIPVSAPAYTNNEAGLASVDYNLSEKDSLRGRFVLNRTGTLQTTAALPVFFQTVPTNAYVATFCSIVRPFIAGKCSRFAGKLS